MLDNRMSRLIHPSKDGLKLSHVLAALADENRLQIVRRLACEETCLSCVGAAPCPEMAKSTLSHHFRILREAGVIQTTKRGVEHRNALRKDDLDERFPGLLQAILTCAA